MDANLRAAVVAGLTVAAFWNSTPYQTALSINAYNDAQQRANKRDLWLAWHVEAFARQKKLPDLKALLEKMDGTPKRRLSSKEMLARVEALNAAAGGKDLRIKANG